MSGYSYGGATEEEQKRIMMSKIPEPKETAEIKTETPVAGYDLVPLGINKICFGSYGKDGLALETHELDKTEAIKFLMNKSSVLEELQKEKEELIYIIKTTVSKENIAALGSFVKKRYGLE